MSIVLRIRSISFPIVASGEEEEVAALFSVLTVQGPVSMGKIYELSCCWRTTNSLSPTRFLLSPPLTLYNPKEKMSVGLCTVRPHTVWWAIAYVQCSMYIYSLYGFSEGFIGSSVMASAMSWSMVQKR